MKQQKLLTTKKFLKLEVVDKLDYLKNMLAPDGVSVQGDQLRRQFVMANAEVDALNESQADVETLREEVSEVVDELRAAADRLESL